MAQAIVRYLSSQYSECLDGKIEPLFGGIFGIFGHGNVAGIGEALIECRESMPYLRGQNEQGMAHTAIAYAKAHKRRRVMGVTTSIGPGATNLLTAAALAHVNRLPVLFLPGDSFASRLPDPVLQQLEDETAPLDSVNDSFRPLSRFFDRINRPEQILASLPQAVRTLTDPLRCGPVTLCLPQDVQTEAYDFPESFFEKKIHRIRRQAPDPRELHEALTLLRQSKRPLIISGGGVHYSGANEALAIFAKKHAIPLAETQAGKASLLWNHPCLLGGIGVTGTRAANRIAAEADCILCIGTRLSDFTTASKTLFSNPSAHFIGLNIQSVDAEKLHASPLVCDALSGIEALENALGEWESPRSHQINFSREIQEWKNLREEACSPTSDLANDAAILGVVNHVADEKTTVVCAAGGLPGELHKLWNCFSHDSYHLEYGYSCMGYEIAGGLGVKLAQADRDIYVMVGDGSYLMLHTELLTARQLGLKLQIIVVDNRGFGCINRLQKSCGCEPFGNLLRDQKGQEVPIDFVSNARSYGCHARLVQNLEDLERTLIENKERDEVCVTVIRSDPEKSSPSYAWWDVAVPEVSQEVKVLDARHNYETQIKKRQ
ncbi:MAG: 3D-(3,5/4)-trihydroxycyclohexane-1,2-dione acylhydrolase (decyclizing) [Waddliaceae bacterium]|nr:3D-(3,5/4)-trihydroxycyclohexane-1,2-dione acylhydrolase (decyclizing) [Waddliaceae bacterium]